MWGGRAWHVPRIVIQETVQGISVKRVVRVRVERRPLPPSCQGSAVTSIVLRYLWLPRYNYTTCRDIAATTLFPLSPRVSPRSAPGRAVPGRNGQATTVEPERLGLARTVVCRGLRVSGERSGGRKPRAGAGAARRRGASPQPARPPARQPLARKRPHAPALLPAPGAPPTRPAVSYFAPRFHSRLKGLSHLRIFIRQYILATPA